MSGREAELRCIFGLLRTIHVRVRNRIFLATIRRAGNGALVEWTDGFNDFNAIFIWKEVAAAMNTHEPLVALYYEDEE